MRADLLALTPETLAELTNRGLVKRAVREVERAAPTVSEDDDGTVRAVTEDGVGSALPRGGLERGSCDCGASGVCRHLVGLVLAYQQLGAGAQQADSPAAVPSAGPPSAGPPPAVAQPAASSSGATPSAVGSASPVVSEPGGARPAGSAAVGAGAVGAGAGGAGEWSPGRFTDEELAARLGERLLAAARRARRAGYVARVRRGSAADPVPSVELPTATVRFLVPGDLGFARSDAAAGARDEVLALAVWAFRAADDREPHAPDARVEVGDPSTGQASRGDGALDRAVALAGKVLRDGAAHLGPGIAGEVNGVRRELEAARLRWPLLAVEDLAAQLDAYRERGARYAPETLAGLVAELHARHRAVTGPAAGQALRSRVLGTGEAAETPLRQARLDGLGARVTTLGDERVVEVFLAHAASATVLVLRRTYETEDTGPALAARRVAGVGLGVLAAGTVVTESAARQASRALRLGTRRLSRTEALTSRGSWHELPRALVADDLAALAAELDALPPRPVRARIDAELVRVLPVAEVRSITYAPGAQRLDAVIADTAGTTAVVSATHASCAPGRLDSVAAALRGDLRFVAGTVRRAGGTVVIDPIGFVLGLGGGADSDGLAVGPGGGVESTGDSDSDSGAGGGGHSAESGAGGRRGAGARVEGNNGAGGRVVVPDLAAAEHGNDPGERPGGEADPLGRALGEAGALLAEVAHRGLLHVPGTMAGRLRTAGGKLTGVGLRRAGESLSALAGLLGADPGAEAADAWVDAHLRVSLADELRGGVA